MNDIRPPKPQPRPQTPLFTAKNSGSSAPQAQEKPQALLEEPARQVLLEPPRKRSKTKLLLWIVGILLAIALIVGAGLIVWYQSQLKAADPNNTNKIRLSIASGSSPTQIGASLKEHGLIRSSFAFDIYTRLAGVRSALQAGTYSLSPSETTPQIVTHLTSGRTDEFSITFLPGATLAENREVLIKAGYEAEEVDKALEKKYDHPLFATKPASADLEGYIYGETYTFESNATVEQILTRTFDEFYKVVKDNNLVALYQQQKLTLFEGITLASIIQREVASTGDQRQVAQVFFKRLNEGTPLGADATFVYGAKKLGVEPSVTLQSPYNTRLHAGLPPGPISSPGKGALLAVGNPAPGDYLYFVSGDDGTTHFSRTEAEHVAKTRQYCHANCSLF